MLNTYDLRQLSAHEADIILHNLELTIAIENGRIDKDIFEEIRASNDQQMEIIRELRLAGLN